MFAVAAAYLLRVVVTPLILPLRHGSRQAAKDELGSGFVFAVVAFFSGEGQKTTDFAKDAASMVQRLCLGQHAPSNCPYRLAICF